jgi:ABC-type lipoprotein export system ATPase subunit
MEIKLKSIIPFPIKNEFSSESELWGKDVLFYSNHFSVIDAHSGKGKSTFTSIVSGSRYDYEGMVSIDGEDIKTFSKNKWSQLRRVNLSFVFQDLQLFDKITVKDNLLIKNQLTDFRSENEIKVLLEQLKIEHKWGQLCGTLSLGQQQRVAIIRALLQPADFIIMDEPFSHLDSENTSLAMNLITSHCNEINSGMILTTLGNKYNLKWDQIIQIG